MNNQGHSPEGATVGTGQKEPRDSRQVPEDVQHEQGHVLRGGGDQPPGQEHLEAGASVCPHPACTQCPVQTGLTVGT